MEPNGSGDDERREPEGPTDAGSGAGDQSPGDADTATTEDGPPRLPVVGIGASAGGLEALEALTERLSTDGMSFVILQHLAPGHESTLTDILSRKTSMKIATVKDGMRVEVNHIYVAPASVDVVMQQDVLRLMAPAAVRRGSRLSIDSFFRSLAADKGNLAIGVILSGAGSDGTLGLKAIKEAGGITFVQEPSTANHPSMPQSALDAGYADFSLTAAEIGDELMRLSRNRYVAAARPRTVFAGNHRHKLFALLRKQFGVDFAAYKQATIERRIQRRMTLHKLDRLEDYLKYIESNAAELSVLYSELLIRVTSFFRDKEPFEALKSLVFPRLLETRRPDAPIRIWVAGCSTGEEAYSIAICLLEYLGDRAPSHAIQIFATDIDEQSLAQARLAVYPNLIEADVSSERLQRFFSRADNGYQIKRQVRDTVIFARHNLGKDPPFSRIDLVSCRNVLIYMQSELQSKVLRVFHYALQPDAFLLLGTSETVGNASHQFSLVDRKNRLYTKKYVTMSAPFDVSVEPRAETAEARVPVGEAPRPRIGVLQLVDRKVLDQYGPPGVVVNDKLDIIQYRGKTGRFFEPAPGIATVNLLKLARPELLPALRPALDKAMSDNVRVLTNPVRLWHDKEPVKVTVDVTPLAEPGGTETALVVLFNEQRGETPPAGPAPDEAEPVDASVQELERELAVTKEELQTTIEEFEAANEELQSSNEELQSSNEELQSTNEELETSKEELQSTNEELVTLNEELENRMAQLNVSIDDLQNVLGTTSSQLVLVGSDLRIRRFTAAAAKLLNLIPRDVGRPVAYVRTVMKARDLEQTVSDAVNEIATKQQSVRSVDGHWYTMRVTPYRTADQLIRGAVIEFVRAVGEEEPTPGDVQGLAGTILATAPQAFGLLDRDMRLTWANNAFLEMFQLRPDLLGRPLEDLWGGKADHPDVWKLLEDAAIEGRPFVAVAIDKPFGQPFTRPMTFSARRLPEDDARLPFTLVIVEKTSENGGDGGE